MNPACETRSGANRPAEKGCEITSKDVINCAVLLDAYLSLSPKLEEPDEEMDYRIYKYIMGEGDDE